jgi:hypothetical protein
VPAYPSPAPEGQHFPPIRTYQHGAAVELVARAGPMYCRVCNLRCQTEDRWGRPLHPLCAERDSENPPEPQTPRSETGNDDRAENLKLARSALGSKRRHWKFKARRPAWVDLVNGTGATEDGARFSVPRKAAPEALCSALPEEVERVYLLGAWPAVEISEVRRWAKAPLREWRVGARGHYLETSRAPVLRFERQGRSVEIHRAAEWFGDAEPTTPSGAGVVWSAVAGAVAAKFDGGTLLATPGQTGRDLWARSIPPGVEFPVLDGDDQAVIRSTSGQGRIETCPAVDELRELVELDGRLMYGALCWQLGAGPVERDGRSEFAGQRRGRYLAEVTVPGGWDHVGVLPLMGERSGWTYPSEPGQAWSGWFDAAEIHLALKWGWPVEIRERMLLADEKAKPLDTWAKKLTELAMTYDQAGARSERSMVRAILLHGIGSFAGRPHRATRSVPVAEARSIPEDVGDVQHVDGALYWSEEMTDTAGEWSHPEWSAAVWGRARCRLLDGPGSTGALHVPRPAVVGFRTDALYLTCDPGWPDDGKAGRFRVKGRTVGPLPAPRSGLELIELRQREAA